MEEGSSTKKKSLLETGSSLTGKHLPSCSRRAHLTCNSAPLLSLQPGDSRKMVKGHHVSFFPPIIAESSCSVVVSTSIPWLISNESKDSHWKRKNRENVFSNNYFFFQNWRKLDHPDLILYDWRKWKKRKWTRVNFLPAAAKLLVLNCSKTMTWHYWKHEARKRQSAGLTAGNTCAGPPSEASPF